MKRFLAGLLALCLIVPAYAGQMTLLGAGKPPAAAAGGYTGPGDIVSSWTAWYGLRCFSTSYTGNVAEIKDTATQLVVTTITCSSGGILNTGSPTALATTCASACIITTLYDQSGSTNCSAAACNATAAPAAAMAFNYSATAANWYATATASTGAQSNSLTSPVSQPYTFSVVAQRTGNFTTQQQLCGTSGSGNEVYFSSSANNLMMYAGSVVAFAATDSTTHALQAIFNGASSTTYLDGTGPTSISNPGAGTQSGAVQLSNTASNGTTGRIWECGLHPTAISSGNQASLNSNQHTYWGF